MLPNLPLDLQGKQIRVGDCIAYSASDSCYMFVGKVVKITNCFVWITPKGFEGSSQFNSRREFRQVVTLEKNK